MKLSLLFYFVLFLFLGISAGAQSVSSGDLNVPSWREHIARRTTAQDFQPFVMDKNAPDIGADIQKATFLRLNPQELQRLLTERPRDLRFQIPTASGEPLTVELFESNPFAPNKGIWAQETDGLKNISVARGLHYWGIVAGKVNSSVAFSFYENQIFGVLLTKEGNYNLGVYGTQANPSVNDLYIFYNDKEAVNHPKFSCGTKESEFPLKKQIEDQVMGNSATCKQVVIYFEADYAFYQAFGSSVPNAVNLIHALFNEVSIFYAVENISIALGDIKIWTTTDPYSALTTCIQYRDEFRDNQLPNNPFTWDLAHLLTTRSLPDWGGYAASLGSLCHPSRGYRSAVSTRIASEIVPYPTYSYTLMLVCHELGHNFGSPHTHSCSWTGGAIDGCTGVEGSCVQPPPASPGMGTVMSYCGANINLSLGFGPLPGARIRNHYQNAVCLNSSFSVEASILTPSQEPAILCSDEGSIDLTAGNCIGCTYQWFLNGVAIPNANDLTYNALQAGNYSVAVRDRGCVAYSPHKNVVTVNAPCQQNGTLTHNQADESCGTAPAGRLTLSGHTGMVLAWQMSTDNFATHTTLSNTTTTYDYPPLTETTCFRVVLAGIPTFSAIKCITVHDPPALTAAATRPVACPSNNLALESYCPTCVTYSWQPAENLLNPTVANPTITVAVTETYTLTATDFNGCTQTATATVTIPDYGIDIERITADEVCAGDLVVYRRNGTIPNGFTGLWLQQFNCTGGWFMATTDRTYFTPFNLINGRTCYRYQFYHNPTSCFYYTNVDTLDVCGTVRFTCTNTQYNANFNQNLNIPNDQINNCQSGNPINWQNDITVPGWYTASLNNGIINHVSQTGNCLLEGFSIFANEGSAERSLGTWNGLSATNTAIGLNCKNETGGTINTLNISYSGEQWYRHENTPIADRLDFQYSIDATNLDNGTWIDFDALDFISPQTSMTGAVNGNLPPYRTDFNNVAMNGLNIPPGQTFWLRWVDYDQNTLTKQDMLSIDDVSVSVTFSGTIPAPVNVSQPITHCSGNTETYKVQSVPGSPPVTYTWSIPGGCAGWNLVSPNGTSSEEMRITAGTGNCSGITVTAQDACGISPAYAFDATVSPCTYIAGILRANQTICSGETPQPLTLTGHTGNVLYWELSTDCPSFSETTLIPYTGTTLILPDYTTTTCFRVMVNTPDGILPSQPATITVGQPVNNVFLDLQTGTFVCTGGCVKINITSNYGTYTRWQKQEGCTGPYTDIPGMDMPNMAYCGIVQKTCFRAVVTNPSCDDVITEHKEINISNPLNPTTGMATASNPTICPGGCTNLTMIASNGTSFQWQEDPGCTNNFTDLRNGGMKDIQVCNITQTTCYRTRITKAECSPVVYSPIATVTVNPALTPPTITVGSPQTTLCSGSCTELSATGADSYNWYPGNLTGAMVSICPLSTTTYTVTGIGASGCTGSATITITVEGCTPVGGEVNPSQTICSGSTPATLSLQNHIGNVIRWEKSTDNFATITTIAHTNTSYDSGTLTQTTCFRAVVGLNPHPDEYSIPACIEVITSVVPAGNVIPGATTLCSGNTGPNMFLVGHSGTIIRWEKSNDNFATVTTIAHTNTIFTGAGIITQTTCFRAVVSDGGCGIGFSQPSCVVPVLPPSAGTLSLNQTICEGSNATVTLSGNNANVIRWETSTDNFAINITTVNQTLTHFTANNVTGTLYIRAVVSNGVCPVAYSNVVTIETVPVSLGGLLSTDATVCQGDNSGSLSLNGYRGNILRWESSVNNFASVTTIANTTDAYTWMNLTQTTKFRVVVQNGICPAVYSNVINVTVLPLPQGGILQSNMTVCADANGGTLTLSGYTGEIQYWEISNDDFISATAIPIQAPSLFFQNLSQTTAYRVVIGNECGVVLSVPATITVVQGTAGGTILNDATVCADNNAGTLVLSNYSGNILHWEVSTDNFTTFSTIANQTPEFQYTNLPVTTWFRVALGGAGGSCANATSKSVKITAVKTAVGGILNNIRGGGGCSVPNGTLLLTGYSGRIIRWESSINNFINVTSIANTTASLNYNVNMATQYRAVLQNVPCPVVYSQVITVNPGLVLNATALRECNNKGKIVAVASGGTPAYSYFITPNSGSQLQAGIFTNVTPGTYTVTARDRNNCTVTRTVTIPSQVSGPYLTGVTFNGLNNARVDWIDVAPGGNTVYYQLRYRKSGGTWTTKNVGSNTTYMLVNLDTVGIRTYEVQVRVRCLPSTVYGAWSGMMNFSLRTEETFAAEQYISAQDLTLYPNPNNGSFTLRFAGEETENDIQIFDMTGRSIYHKTFISSETENECLIDLSHQAKGIYHVMIRQGYQTKTLKVIIE